MTLELTLHTAPEVPLEADVLTPDRLQGLDAKDAATLPVLHGNRAATLGDFFKVKKRKGDDIHVSGDLQRIKLIGAGMSHGRVVIHGDVGAHLGAEMSGGELLVEGSAGDWVAPEMSGGRIVIQGDAGHMVGSGFRGSQLGMRGGEIIVHGGAGNECGNTMRRGLIAIGGDCGDFTGVNMIAGTIAVLGSLGIRTGAGMKRGTILSMHDTPMLPTFSYACTYQPTFLRLFLLHLRSLGLGIEDAQIRGRYRRFSGDSVALNRGEVLLLDA